MPQTGKISNKILIIPNNKSISNYNYTSFILPLKNYSIGFDVYFDINEINELSSKYNIYIIINKFMHKDDIRNIEVIINKLKNIKGFFLEDFGLIDIIGKEKAILYQNHIINNYKAINYLKSIGFENVVVSNELTFKELKKIKENTNSKLYYFLINKNIIMYSKRSLLSNYYKYYNIDSNKNLIVLSESLKKHKLILKEEDGQSVIYNYDTFCGSKYLNILEYYDYLIVNLTLLNEEESKIVLNNIENKNLHSMINTDNYFLENEIKYRVKDL